MGVLFFKILYFLIIFLLAFFQIIEVHVILYCIPLLFLLIDTNSFISKETFDTTLILFLIVIIGLISSLFNSKTFYDWIKDIVYFLKPILALISGFYIAKKIGSIRFLVKTIVIVAFLSASLHLFRIFYHIGFNESSISSIRQVGGVSNMFEVIAIILIYISYKFSFLMIFRNKILKNTVLIVLLFSFIMYFSRTMFVALLIFCLSIFGYLKLTSKGLKYIFITTSLIGLFYIYLFSIDIERDKPGIDSFLYKMKIAPSEIFVSSENISVNNHDVLWDHWRAYEATMAFKEMNEQPSSYINGKGFGSLVDLEFEAPLGDEPIQFIPILHNGYVYILLKTGVIGLLIYLILLMSLYLNSYKKRISREHTLVSDLIAGISIYYLFTTLIITGVYNSSDVFTFMLGILFCLQQKLSNTHNLIEYK